MEENISMSNALTGVSEKITELTGDSNSIPTKLFELMARQFKRSEKFDNLMLLIEDIMLSETFLNSIRNNPDELKKLYSFLAVNKEASENKILKILDLITKNALLKEMLRSNNMHSKDSIVVDNEPIPVDMIRNVTAFIKKTRMEAKTLTRAKVVDQFSLKKKDTDNNDINI